MNFEQKLNNDLPWSQKFRDEYRFEDNSFVAEDGIVQVRAFSYETPDRRFKCFVTHFDRKKDEEGYDFIQFDYRRKDQSVSGKIYSESSRVGGPSFYRLVNGEIVDIEYWLHGQKVPPSWYWVKLCTSVVKHFEADWRNDVVYFKSKSGKLPCPHSYDIKRQRFTYKIGKRKVTVSDFWKHWEQRFVNIDLHG